MRRFRKNNKGMTLVELIVSIAIMAIIVIPILNSFLTSSKTNAKAKVQQRATEVAQNVMEQLAAMSASDVLTVCAEDSGSVFLTETAHCILSETTADDVTTYQLALQDVSADGRTYDVCITLEGTSVTLPDVNRISSSHDALSLAAQTALEDTDTLIDGYGLVASEISRTITVTIEGDPGEAATGTVSRQYHYTYNGTDYDYPTDASLASSDFSDVIFQGDGTTDTTLEKVYLFYYPWYASNSTASLLDEIEIVNEDRLDVDVILVKQEDTSITALEDSENRYLAVVNVTETGAGAYSASNITLYTNLGRNLFSGTSTTNGDTQEQYYWLNGASAGSALSVCSLTAEDTEGISFGGMVSVEDDGTYDSAIAGAARLVTITGGMSN